MHVTHEFAPDNSKSRELCKPSTSSIVILDHKACITVSAQGCDKARIHKKVVKTTFSLNNSSMQACTFEPSPTCHNSSTQLLPCVCSEALHYLHSTHNQACLYQPLRALYS